MKTFLVYKEFFYPVLKEHIRGNYGYLRLSKQQYEKKCADNTLTDEEREDYLTPGPFSFATYLHALLNPSFWGDEICLVGISMMWQVKITVLNADTLHTIRIRHTNILHRADMVLVHCEGNHYIPAVRRVVNEGIATDDVDVLKVRALILSEGYNLQYEQPEVFDDHMDPDKFTPQRELTGQAIPVSTSCAAASSTGQAGARGISEELIAGLVATHHSHADLLKSLGVDACALYKAKQKEVSVIDVLPKQLQCKLCNQEFAQVGNLKVHIRRFHQEEGTLRDKNNFECGVCKKVFGESYILKTHMKLHEEGGKKFRCDQSKQSFISVGKLNEHKKHHQGKVPCHCCGREMVDPRGLKEHQKRCR